MTTDTDELLLTSQETAALYKVTVQLLRLWEKAGVGPVPIRRGGIKRYRKVDVLADIDSGGGTRAGAVA